MPNRPRHLPDFDDPPVVETVLSVQFEPLPSITAAHLGLLWAEFRSAFPRSEHAPPIEPAIEEFPDPLLTRVGMKLHTTEGMPIPRIWFVNDSGTEMIQVQNDRFIKNWRKERDVDLYPHYDETIRPHFDRDYAIFETFLIKNDLGVPNVNQCEVTYVNHILAGKGWDRYGQVEKIFTFWHPQQLVPTGALEDLRLHAKFVIPDERNQPIGRLHVDLQPAVRTSDNHPMYVLHLTARGKIGRGLDFFDVGRDWIVKTFKNLTTNSMHKLWRIKDAANS